MNNKISLVQAQLDAYNRRDLKNFCECYHPEVIVKLLMENTTLIQGMRDFIDSYENLFQLHPEQLCQLKSRIITADSIIDEEFITGRANHPDGLHAVAIYGFRDDLIDRVWFI